MNRVVLTGRFTKDIDFKALENGALSKCSLAVDEGYGDKKYTNFFDVVMFGKTAENVANHSGKGRKVLIEGRMKQERWDKDGKNHSAIKVYAENVEFLDYKEREGGQKEQQDPFVDEGKPLNFDDTDLPF